MTLAIEYYETGKMPAIFEESAYVGKEKLVSAQNLLNAEDQRYISSVRGMMVAMNIPDVGERMVLLTRTVPESASLVRDVADNSVITFPLCAGG